jgi:hypothetical protein
LVALNPHVDFKKIEPGTVLLVPDGPGLRAGETASVSGQPFDELREQVLAAVEAAGARARSGHAAQLAEQKEVTAALKSAGLRAALEIDPELRAQIEAALQVFKQDQQDAKAAAETLKSLAKQAATELDALAKLLA